MHEQYKHVTGNLFMYTPYVPCVKAKNKFIYLSYMFRISKPGKPTKTGKGFRNFVRCKLDLQFGSHKSLQIDVDQHQVYIPPESHMDASPGFCS